MGTVDSIAHNQFPSTKARSDRPQSSRPLDRQSNTVPDSVQPELRSLAVRNAGNMAKRGRRNILSGRNLAWSKVGSPL